MICTNVVFFLFIYCLQLYLEKIFRLVGICRVRNNLEIRLFHNLKDCSLNSHTCIWIKSLFIYENIILDSKYIKEYNGLFINNCEHIPSNIKNGQVHVTYHVLIISVLIPSLHMQYGQVLVSWYARKDSVSKSSVDLTMASSFK